MKTHNPFVLLRRPCACQSGRFHLGALALLLAALQLIAWPVTVPGASPPLSPTEIAREVAEGVGAFVRQTPPTKTGPVYVFEENHASLRGQVQIATMLTRLHKRYGLRAIGLEGSIQANNPLPAKTFVPGSDIVARQDALRRMLGDGEISGVEYVGAVNLPVEIWGLENKEQYDVQPPDGVSSSFLAVVAISEKLVPEKKLLEFIRLFKAEKIDEAIKLLKESHPWIREQLEPQTKASIDLQASLKREQNILKKAQELNVELPPGVMAGMQQTMRFYEMAERRSDTMTRNMAELARRRAGEPTAMVIGAAHTEKVMQALTSAGVHGVLLRAKNLQPATNDLGLQAFENKVKGLWANDAEGSIGSFLNKTRGGGKADHQRKPPPRIGDLSRQSLGSAEYVTSVVAEAARSGRRIPADLPKELSSLPGGVSIDPNSFSQDGYDVIFCVIVDEPGKERQRIWLRAGTVKTKSGPAAASNSKEGDMTQLEAADNEPPRKPPVDEKSTKSDAGDPNPGRNEPRKEGTAKEESSKKVPANEVTSAKADGTAIRGLLADVNTKYKAFATKAEAQACPRLSSQ